MFVKRMIADFIKIVKKVVLKIFQFMENKWFKIAAIIILLVFSVNFVFKQFFELRETITNLTPNVIYLGISFTIFLITVLLSVYSWRFSIAAFGFSFSWIDIAHAQMLSMIGKYIPGHIWNYSSKIYLSYKMGFPIKLSGFAVVIEMVITYLIAINLLFIFFPTTIISFSSNWLIVPRLLGSINLALMILAPLLFSKKFRERFFVKSQSNFIIVIIIRLILWVLPSYAFILLILSLGYPGIGISHAISAITSSFFVGFIAVFVPDGFVVREALIIFFLSNTLSTADATLISLVFRFQMVLVDFTAVIIVILIKKVRNLLLNK